MHPIVKADNEIQPHLQQTRRSSNKTHAVWDCRDVS